MDRQLEEEEIRAQASIYKKDTTRPLSDYQKKVNKAAQDICVKNPSLLRSRQKLLEAARSKVDETYQFKKGKSRSKRHDPVPPLPKRKKINQAARLERMKTLEDDLKSMKERISYKQKRRQIAEETKNYRLCDDITEEIAAISKESRQLEAELKLLTKKDVFSKQYQRRTCKSMNKSSSETCSPQNSVCSDILPALVAGNTDDPLTLSDSSSDNDRDSNL